MPRKSKRGYKRGNRRKGRRSRRPRQFLISKFPNTTRPTIFGPGRYRMAVTKLFNGSLSSELLIKLHTDILYNNPELLRILDDFKYVKLKGVCITFYARNLQTSTGNATPCYLLVNFDGERTENVRLQDNVKVIPPFLIRNKIFKYRIPCMNAGGGVLNKWYSTQDLFYYNFVAIQIHAPENTTNWIIRFDAVLCFRGPTNLTAKQYIGVTESQVESDEGREANWLRKANPDFQKPILKKIEENKKKNIKKTIKIDIKDKEEDN